MNTSLQNIESTPHNVVWISYENKSIPVPVTSLDNPAFLTREQNFLHSYKILRFSPKDPSHAELMLRPIFKAHLPREVLGTPVQKNGWEQSISTLWNKLYQLSLYMRSSKDSLYFSDIKDCFLCPEDIFSKDDMDQIPDPQSLITEWIYLLLEQVPLIPVRSWLLCNMCVEYGYYGEDLSINLLSPPLCKAPALTITLSIGRNLYSDTLFLFLSSSLQAHYAKDPPTPLVLPSTGNTSNIAFGDLSISVPVSTAIDNLDTRLVPSGNVLRDYHCLTHQDSRYCIVPPPEFRYTIGDITFRNGTHNTEDFSLFLSWIQFMLSYLASDYTARKTLLKNLYHIEFQAFRRILDNDTLEQNYRTPEDFSELLDSLCFLMDTCIQLLRPNSTLLQTVYDRAKRKKNGMLWKEKQICVISQGKHIESQVLSMIMRFEVVSENTIRVRISYNVPTKPEKRTNSPHLWISTTPNLRSEDFKPLTNML